METAAATLLEVNEQTARFTIRLGDIPRQASLMGRAARLELAATLNSAVHSLVARYLSGQKVDPETSICSELDDFDQSSPAETAGGLFVATRSGLNIFCHFTKSRKDGDHEPDDDPAGPSGGDIVRDETELEFVENVAFLLIKDLSTEYVYQHVVINIFVPEDRLFLRLADGQHRHPIAPDALDDAEAAALFCCQVRPTEELSQGLASSTPDVSSEDELSD